MSIKERIEAILAGSIKDSKPLAVYEALLQLTKEMAQKSDEMAGKKKIYYISAEFLIGKLLSNNLINLGIYDEVDTILKQNGMSLAELEDLENEPSLGNGGLGRLAACFLDSIATLGLHGAGIGLNYHLGLFRQMFEENMQKELPNPWIQPNGWLTKTDITYPVSFGGMTVQSRLYNLDVVGYKNQTIKLHLFDLETVDESCVQPDTIQFDLEDIKKNLTLFLYPDDSTEAGRKLRIYQQYFMVSNAARLILEQALERGSNLHDLNEYAVIQINDTHPSMIIPEMIRLLGEHGIVIEEAIEIVSHMCAYTNHTILAEALEKWPIAYLEEIVPQLVVIIRELDNLVRQKKCSPDTWLIKDQLVHMAHMDIHYSFSVNGVAALHTEILKETELHEFYELYPEKFNNKTNGITFRRWLLSCNPSLSQFVTELIGEGWKKDAMELEKLAAYEKDTLVLDKLVKIKLENKEKLASYLEKTKQCSINPRSIFDIQIKRLHEYKRQQLNALYVIDKYFEIKEGILPSTPITVIFGAKAAPAYTIAKDIIHLILCLQQLIQSDEQVRPYLNVVMVENYNVTLAEKLIPACDISEQISLASKEASGTGNMKFMLNGAVTLGTRDGANVEIEELVGPDNIYIFGEQSDTVIERYQRGDYCAKQYYESNPSIKRAVDFIISDTICRLGKKEKLMRLYNELTQKDWFMTFPDFEAYKSARNKAYKEYEDTNAWARKMLINISKAGFFSSDRTIAQYNQDIWKLS